MLLRTPIRRTFSGRCSQHSPQSGMRVGRVPAARSMLAMASTGPAAWKFYSPMADVPCDLLGSAKRSDLVNMISDARRWRRFGTRGPIRVGAARPFSK
jgi:hypothetical protein